MREALG
jgi:hypothetical protein